MTELVPGVWHVIARRPTMPPLGLRIQWTPVEDAPMTTSEAYAAAYAKTAILMHRRTHDGWTEAVVALWPASKRRGRLA